MHLQPCPVQARVKVLHVHLEGSIRPETLLELAARNDVELPARTVDELRDWYAFKDFDHFVDVYLAAAGWITLLWGDASLSIGLTDQGKIWIPSFLIKAGEPAENPVLVMNLPDSIITRFDQQNLF